MIDISMLQVDSPISYVIALVVPGLDAVIPVLPSETAIIALGVATAGSVDPRIAVLVALAAFGAFLGDNLSYFVGQHFGPRVDRRFFSGEKGTLKGASTRFCPWIPGSVALVLRSGARQQAIEAPNDRSSSPRRV